jgi:hypothetical protein
MGMGVEGGGVGRRIEDATTRKEKKAPWTADLRICRALDAASIQAFTYLFTVLSVASVYCTDLRL